MNKFLKYGATMALSLGMLAACGGNDGANNDKAENGAAETPAETPTTPEEANLTIWLDDESWADSLIEALEVALPHINISFEEVGSVDTLSKLALDGPAGLGADIFIMPHDHMADGISQNLLLPLGAAFGEMMEGRILDSALGTVSHNDNYFGVPLSTESIALFYNRTLLEEHGLEVATTFEEIIEQAAEFNNPAANEFVLRFQASDPFINHFFLTSHGFELFGPNHDDADAVNFDTPETVAGLEFFQSIREILPVPVGDLDWDNTVIAFANGKVPYTITGPWAFGAIQEEDGGFDWGVKTIPTINGVQPVTFSGNIIGAISSFSQNVDAAREVLNFMASDEGLQLMYEVRGTIPALQDPTIIDGLKDDPFTIGILDQAEYSHPMPIIPEMSAYWGAAASMFEGTWEGLLTPAQASERAYNEFLEALRMAQQ